MKVLIITATIINITICSVSIYENHLAKDYSKEFVKQIERHRNEVKYFDKEVNYFIDKAQTFSDKVDTLRNYMK